MSDIGGGQGFGEVGIGGSINFTPRGRGNMFQRAMMGRQGVTGNVSASLKFDIPGLKDFRTELENIRKALEQLDRTFAKISDAPARWAKNLAAANKELSAMKGNVGGIGGGSGGGISLAGVSGGGGGGGFSGMSGLITAAGTRAEGGAVLSGMGKFGNVLSMLGGAGGGGGAAAGGGGMMAAAGAAGPVGLAAAAGLQVAQMLGEMSKRVVAALMERFDKNMDQMVQADVYLGRMATATGISPSAQMNRLGNKGFGVGETGVMAATPAEFAQAMYRGYSMGFNVGGAGLGGQRGLAFQQSIGVMQQVMPGMTAGEASQTTASAFANVQGQRQGRLLFGNAALTYEVGTGRAKTLPEYFSGILKKLQNLPRRSGNQGRPYSKEEIGALRMPGSNANVLLSQLFQGNPELQEAFWNWAEANAASAEAGMGQLSLTDAKEAQRQLNKARGTEGLISSKQQEVQAADTSREFAMGSEQYGTIRDRLVNEKAQTELLQSIDDRLGFIQRALGRVPSGAQGFVQSLFSAGWTGPMGLMTSLASNIPIIGGLFGDPGYMGDVGFIGDAESGLSHLTPDLRKRVGAMMAANPNLQVTSAYRDNLRQQRLRQKGGPFAPSGKSKHGMGQAIDLGPASQHGWIKANARRFGLGDASHMGEPWHVQLAGSLGFMGDPMDPTEVSRQAVARGMQHSREQFARSMTAAQTTTTTTPSGGTEGTEAVVGGGAGGGGGTAGALGGGWEVKMDYAGPGTKGVVLKEPVTTTQMVDILYRAGFRGEDLIKMTGIGQRESINGKYVYGEVPRTKDWSWGLWMMNDLNTDAGREQILQYMKQGGGSKMEDYYDPQLSANATYQMFQHYKTLAWANYNPYRPWGAYKGYSELHNVSQAKLDEARAYAKQKKYIGDAGFADAGYAVNPYDQAPSFTDNSRVGGSGYGSMSLSAGGITFNNTFHIQLGSGGGSRSDVDTAARQIASRLEAQMKRVVARNT